MKHIKLIILCLLTSITAVQANTARNIIGFYIGMTREQATDNLHKHKQQNICINIGKFTQPSDSMSLYGMDVDTYDVTNAACGMAEHTRPTKLILHPVTCNIYKNKKLRQIKSDEYFVVYNARNAGVMMLGFSGNELVEITVSPLLFNWISYPPQSIATMLEKNWKIKFTLDNSIPMNPQWVMVDDNSIIAVTSNQMIYMGKNVSEKDALPTMSLQKNNTQYYTCILCQQESLYGKQNVKQSFNQSFTPQSTPPAANNGMAQGFSFSNNSASTSTPKHLTCRGCNGGGKSKRYIEPPYSSSTRYVWCDICKLEVKPHTHRLCEICQGLGYTSR